MQEAEVIEEVPTTSPNGSAPEEVLAEPPREITLSNGIILHLRAVPPFIIRDAAMKVERPKPPIVHIPEKGRSEENPADPDYQDALVRWEGAMIDAGMRQMLRFGVERIELPEGMRGPDDEEWVENLRDADMDCDVSTVGRRNEMWLRYVAMATSQDISLVTNAVGLLSGISEREVSAATSSFRNRALRRADRERSSQDA